MNKRNIIILLCIFEIALVTFFGYATGHYSTDNYNIINKGYNEYSLVNNLKEGRPIMYLIDQIALKINMSYELFIKLTVILAIFITSVTVVIFFNIVRKYFKDRNFGQEVFILLISYTIFFNFMYIENLYFVESIVMALSLLLYVISANYLVERRNVIFSIFLAIISVFCYNGFLCAYITLVCILSLLKNKDNYKKVIKDILYSGFIIILTVIINLIQIKIVCNVFNMINNRMGSLNINVMLYNIVYIINSIPLILINTAELFPKYFYILFIMFISIITLLYSIKNKNRNVLYSLLLITFVSIFSCFCIFIISLSSFWTGRLYFGIGMTIGALFLVLTQYTDKNWKNILLFTFMIYFIINIINAMYVIKLHKEVNILEETEISNLEKYISDYEKENNCEVDKIVYIEDASFNNLYYARIKRYTVVTYRALACNWACVGAINFYTGRNLKQIQPTDEIMNFYNNANTEENSGIICYNDILICPVSCW